MSPKDNRFRFVRHYRSDDARLGIYGSLLMFGGTWRHNYMESLQRNLSPEPDTFTLNDSLGNRYEVSGLNPGTTTQPGVNAKITTTGCCGYSIYYFTWDEGSGRKRTFKYAGGNTMRPYKITWADGYEISYSTNTYIDFIKDNRGQYAQYTWSNSVVSNSTRNVVSRIDIDTDYDEVAIDPEVRLYYTYAENTLEADRPLIIRVEREDVATGITETLYEYDYLERDGKTTSPPLLTAIRDGRLDANGLPFDYATFEYNYGGNFADVVTTPADELTGYSNYWTITQSGHFGGADQWTRNGDTYTNPLGMTYSFPQVSAGKLSQTSAITMDGNAQVAATSVTYGYTPNAGAPEGYVYERTDRNGADSL
tara:strand:+ start:372301 stop:373398 length:1098 start_codon:yes stop_codon:yes gene_type:complete